jgi:hypothetical protein
MLDCLSERNPLLGTNSLFRAALLHSALLVVLCLSHVGRSMAESEYEHNNVHPLPSFIYDFFLTRVLSGGGPRFEP